MAATEEGVSSAPSSLADTEPVTETKTGRPVVKLALVLLAATGALAAIFAANAPDAGPTSDRSRQGVPAAAGEYELAVGNPGSGEEALPIRLPSTKGGVFDLAGLRGQTVLLYFQEGLMCQPCWDQLKDIEKGG